MCRMQKEQPESDVCRPEVDIKEQGDGIRPVRFMRYEIGNFDLDTPSVKRVDSPFGAKVFLASMGRRNACFKNIGWSLPVQGLSRSGI